MTNRHFSYDYQTLKLLLLVKTKYFNKTSQMKKVKREEQELQNDIFSLQSIRELIPAKFSSESQKLFNSLLNEAVQEMGEKQVTEKYYQWRTLLNEKLNSNGRVQLLKDVNHRKLLLSFIKSGDVKLYKHSYFNRSKLDDQYLKYLEILRPANFMEVLMLVNKLKVINKFYYHQLKQQAHENEIDFRIIRILQTCNVRQRSINSTMNKFLMIVEDDFFRIPLIRELGKLLRQSFKKDKGERNKYSGQKIADQLLDQQSEFIKEGTLNREEAMKLQSKSGERVKQVNKVAKNQPGMVGLQKIHNSNQNSEQQSIASILQKSRSIEQIFNPYDHENRNQFMDY